MVNYFIGSIIFAYAVWTIYRYVQKSKQGKCAACSAAKTCPTKTTGQCR